MATSIYCDHIESECFNFSNCMKCKYCPSTFVPEKQAHRIAQVAEMLALIHINKFCMDMGAELMYIETISIKDGDTNG